MQRLCHDGLLAWRRGQVLLALIPMLLPALLGGCRGEPHVADAGWMQNALWDDGNAEFATYEVTWSRYGGLYPGRAILVLVKEAWAPDLQVKADTPREDGFEVLKLNHLRDVPTGIYTYHQAASVFLKRDSGELVKLASSSTEACGITTAQWRDGVLETHSYFDGQGDRRTTWPEAAWPWEAMPAVLRSFVKGDTPQTIDVFVPLLNSRLPELQAHTWRLTRTSVDRVSVPAGDFAGVSIELRRGDETMTWVFDAAFPHVLLRYQESGGTTYRLAKVERMAYWQQHQPGDQAWYPTALRDGYTP
jgi:hypothetical protein